nr:helix-turn-helix domain-containing protein [Rubrivivax sp. A210]
MTTEPTAPESAGALLRAARERQGLHIAALAAAIKVAPRKLEALEHDRWHELPDATFVRALAQTVCRTLKIDPRPVLDRLPAAATAALEGVGGDINEPFRERPGYGVPGFSVGAVMPLVWAAGALLLAAIVIYLLPPGLLSARLAAVPAALPASAPSLAASAVAVAPEPPASGAAVAAAAEPSQAAALPPPAGETVFSAPPPEPAASAALAAGAPAGVVQLRCSEPSWVEVRDARGQLLLSRIVQPGESVGLDGALPIRLTIGNAATTQLMFRGQPVDLASRTRDNVARLELQ